MYEVSNEHRRGLDGEDIIRSVLFNSNEHRRGLDTERMMSAIKIAIAKAIEEHRKAGRSIVIWRDGNIVVVPPEQIKPLDKAP